MKKYIAIILTVLFPSLSFGQSVGVDPILPGMIVGYTLKAKAQYNAMLDAMGLETTGHVWTEAEVSGTNEFHEKFNEYLNSFNNVICFAAQIYGFYHEIDRLQSNFGSLSSQIADSPSNLLAIALHTNRNKLYIEIVQAATGIVDDIKQVCGKKTKMTEKERWELVFQIRPKLKALNKKLSLLIKAVKYTTLGDVWRQIKHVAHEKKTFETITEECLDNWKANAKGDKKK